MDWIQRIDVGIVEAFNSLVRKSVAFDQIVLMFEQNSLFKTGLVVFLLCYAWFSSRNQPATRRLVIRTFLAAFLAIVVARVANLALPVRLRPIHDPALQLRLVYGLERETHVGRSSFPSDHAVLLCAVATGLWAISRRYGAMAFAWLLVAVFSARVFTGLHYPSDIAAGGLLGIGIMWLVLSDRRFTPKIVDHLMAAESRSTARFYSVAFLVTWQVANLFGEFRNIAWVLGTLGRHR